MITDKPIAYTRLGQIKWLEEECEVPFEAYLYLHPDQSLLNKQKAEIERLTLECASLRKKLNDI